MKNKKKLSLRTLCVGAGIFLFAAAAVLLLSWQVQIRICAQRAEGRVEAIRTAIPTPQSAVPQERRDNTMPVLSLDGTDFVGLLELPRYDAALPVCAVWGQPSRYPCRFSGSVHDGTLQIGATSQKGQLDFYRELSVGDTLYFTDMEGNRYAFTVTDLHYAKHADQAALSREEAALTIFIKNVYAFEYLVVFCDVRQ